jgi:hypothetical protein
MFAATPSFTRRSLALSESARANLLLDLGFLASCGQGFVLSQLCDGSFDFVDFLDNLRFSVFLANSAVFMNPF